MTTFVALPIVDSIIALLSEYRYNLMVGAKIDWMTGDIVVLFANFSTRRLSFDWFEPNEKFFPDFNNVEIIDGGLALRLGEYEVSSRSIKQVIR